MNGVYIQKKRKKKKNPLKKLVGWLILLVLFISVLKVCQYSFSLITKLKVFTIKELKVDAPLNISKDKIIKLTGINDKTRLYDISLKELTERIKKDPWVKKIKIWRSIPSKIEISVTSKDVVALAKVNGSIYYIDDTGAVVDKLIIGFKNDLPIINAPDNRYLEVISIMDKLKVLGELSEASLEEQVLTVYVSDSDIKIKLDINNLSNNINLIKKVKADLNEKNETASVIDATLPGNKVVVKGLRKR